MNRPYALSSEMRQKIQTFIFSKLLSRS